MLLAVAVLSALVTLGFAFFAGDRLNESWGHVGVSATATVVLFAGWWFDL